MHPTSSTRFKAHRGEGRERRIHSVCLGCNARCGIRFHVSEKDNEIKRVSGNPYHPYNMLGRPIDYNTPINQALEVSGSLCGKAHDVKSYTYNKYRILRPLKRCGRRGEGRFEPISWERLIREIAFGGRLFEHIGEKRDVPGLKDLLDDAPIRPDAPELGPKRNGFCFMTGRLQPGRKAFIDRFVKYAFGSINRIGHTDICGIGFRMGNFAFTGGKEVELKADPWNAKYIIVFGANIYEALQPGLNTYGAVIARRHSKGEVKFVVVDPRAQKASAHADRWVPIKPGQDGAFAMGLIRWMIEHKTYNTKYLECPNPRAAARLGNGAFVNATHLVIWDEGHARHGHFLRMKDIDENGNDDFCVIHPTDRRPVSYLAVDKGMLDVDSEISDAKGRPIRVRSAFSIMKEEVMRFTISEYAEFSGVSEKMISEVAEEFSRYAPYSCVCQYHGAGNYVNGIWASYAVAVLNALSGSIERRGGYCSKGGSAATWKKGPYDLVNFKGKRRPFGVKISREKAIYEKSTEFRQKKAKGLSPYPAKRPWFPFTKGGLSVEALAGIDQGYPYPISLLFLYFYNPVYSTPGGQRFQDTLRDVKKVPLLVSIDVGINESNIYADYIIPDVTYAEGHYGWLSPHAPCHRFTAIRTPAISPLTEKTPDGRPICLETFLIDLAIALGLTGFGKHAIKDREGKLHPLLTAEDFYLRGFANIAHNLGLKNPSDDSIRFVEENYPISESKSILKPEEWKAVCTMLARGGAFLPYDSMFEGERFKSKIKQFYIYNERLKSTVNSITGKTPPGTISYIPPRLYDDDGYPFQLVSFKSALHTQSRTVWHEIAMELHPENALLMNKADAMELGLNEGTRVKVFSPDNLHGIIMTLRPTHLVRKGVVAMSHSYGHWQLGASRLFLQGTNPYAIGDKALGAGGSPNLLSALDPKFSNTPYVDLLTGIPDFSSTKVMVVRHD